MLATAAQFCSGCIVAKLKLTTNLNSTRNLTASDLPDHSRGRFAEGDDDLEGEVPPGVLLVGVAEDLDAGREELVELRPQELGAALGHVDDRLQGRVVLAAFNRLHRHLAQEKKSFLFR